MTVAELLAALASLPDSHQHALLLLDGELVRVRALTSTEFEPRTDLQRGCAVIRVERA